MNKTQSVFCRAEIAPYRFLEKPKIIVPHSNTETKFCISENNAFYKQFNQFSETKKSFHFSHYDFETNAQKFFFDKLLFYDDEIAHLWFTKHEDFLLFYFDKEIKAKCFFKTDFLVEMKNKFFFAFTIGNKKFAKEKILSKKAKLHFANKKMQNSNLHFMFIDEKFIFSQSENASFSLKAFLK